jgi:hypothetical protein
MFTLVALKMIKWRPSRISHQYIFVHFLGLCGPFEKGENLIYWTTNLLNIIGQQVDSMGFTTIESSFSKIKLTNNRFLVHHVMCPYNISE